MRGVLYLLHVLGQDIFPAYNSTNLQMAFLLLNFMILIKGTRSWTVAPPHNGGHSKTKHAFIQFKLLCRFYDSISLIDGESMLSARISTNEI